jgi:ATP-binding cassette subfamily B protein
LSQALKFVIDQCKIYRKEIFLGTVLLIITNALGVYIPLKLKDAVDDLIKSQMAWNVDFTVNLLMLLGMALLMAFIRTGSRVVLFGVGRKIESWTKQDFYNHLIGLDFLYFNTQRIGDLISRSTNDIQAVRQMMGFGLLNIINIVWVYALTLPVMLNLNVWLTVFILLGYIPVLFLVRHLSIQLKGSQHYAQQQLGALSSFIEEDLNGIQVIKAYSQEEREIERFEKINDTYRKVSIELAQWRGIIWPLMDIARGISFFILLAYAASGKLSAGEIAAFLIFLERLLFPTAIVGWLITIFQKGSVSIERIEEIFKHKAQITDKTDTELALQNSELKVNNLHYRFNGNGEVLKGMSLNISNERFVGIVGFIGSGKTTLCNSILRLLDIPPESIVIANQDITEVTLKSLREKVVIVPQETFLFNRTIKENIACLKEFSDEEIKRASQIAQLEDEIKNFAFGYETMIGEKGVFLSGGQAQRLSIARAVIRNPKILILDDAVSSVDNEVGLKILQSLHENLPETKIILVTHRITSLKDADTIFVLDKGSCVGQGKHIHLLKTNEFYQKLWMKQQLVSS